MNAFQSFRPQRRNDIGKKVEKTIGESIETSAPVRFVAAALDLAAMCSPKHLKRLELAAAADEQANKETAQKMRGYPIDSIGHAIKKALFDRGLLDAAWRASLKTLIATASFEAFYFAGWKPFEAGLSTLSRGGSPLLAIGELAGGAVLMTVAASAGFARFRAVDSAIDRAASSKGRSRNVLTGATGALLRRIDWATRRLIPKAWAERLARKILSDARAFALFQGVVEHFGGGSSSWASRIAAVEWIAQATGYQSLTRTDIPPELNRSLVVNGLVPYPVHHEDKANGVPVGRLQAAKLTESHLGAAARSGLAESLVTAAGFLALWHPAILNWAPLLEAAASGGSLVPWLSQAFLIDPLLPFEAGVYTGMATLRERLARAYESANFYYDTDTVQQKVDAFVQAADDLADDQVYDKQVGAYNEDTTPKLLFGHCLGHMNRKGRHNAPLPHQEALVSILALFQHVLITGGTGRGKSARMLTPFIKQILALSVEFKVAHLEQLVQALLAGDSTDRADLHFRDPSWTVPTLSLFVIDPKGALADLVQKICNDFGLIEDLRIIGPDTANGEYTIDMFGHFPAQKCVDLLQAAVARGSKAAEELWGNLAKDVERAALTLAKVWQQTPEGVRYARKHRIKPDSPLFIFDLIYDPKNVRMADCIEDIEKAMAAGDPYVVPLVDGDFQREIDLLTGETWLAAPAPETKMGIRVNIQQHLTPLTSNPAIARTFGSGYSERVMSIGEVWGNPISGCITAVNISPIFGESTNVMNTYIKSCVLFEADLREERFNKAARVAAEPLMEIHRHLFQTELADESLTGTQNYLALQQAAWPILERVATELAQQGLWPEDFGLDEQNRPLFGAGDKQSQYRRALRWLRKEATGLAPALRQPVTEAEFTKLDLPEAFRKSQNAAGIARAGEKLDTRALTSGLGFFRGDAIGMRELLERNQLGLEDSIRGVREEEELLFNYIKNAGAPASPGENLIEIPPAIERTWMVFTIDEYTEMATPGIDVQSAKTARSKRFAWIVSFQTPDTANEALDGEIAANALTENFTTKVFLPDTSGKTLQIINTLSGQVRARDPGAKPELFYEERLHMNLNKKNPSERKDPSMPPLSPEDLDEFCEVFVTDHVSSAKRATAIGDVHAIAAPLAMNPGVSRTVQADKSTHRPVVDGDKVTQHDLEQWELAREERAQDKDDKRLDAQLRMEDAVTRNDWAGRNRVFFQTLMGHLEVQDFIDLDVDQKAIVAGVKRELARAQQLVEQLEELEERKFSAR